MWWTVWSTNFPKTLPASSKCPKCKRNQTERLLSNPRIPVTLMMKYSRPTSKEVAATISRQSTLPAKKSRRKNSKAESRLRLRKWPLHSQWSRCLATRIFVRFSRERGLLESKVSRRLKMTCSTETSVTKVKPLSRPLRSSKTQSVTRLQEFAKKLLCSCPTFVASLIHSSAISNEGRSNRVRTISWRCWSRNWGTIFWRCVKVPKMRFLRCVPILLLESSYASTTLWEEHLLQTPQTQQRRQWIRISRLSESIQRWPAFWAKSVTLSLMTSYKTLWSSL